ncbi:uncharacterized protein DUF1566 [Desulfobotulus alkaliphilus]|uniref:Uncharacterized protein DUF1566 n=1 Tax=Desulfobotulus alkaliphilus TaxID=622671 RepID=A0A562RYL2_9BACT|nr:DUF1566 domain-containing protein [Desulfobotulus alkaliphilus]TWI73978.1 uncharacterized protein DUF1566 [Desulfobotulus alkaliphilus]
MKKNTVQVKGCYRENMVVFLGVMMVFCVAGVVQAAGKPDFSRFPEVAGSNGSIVRDNTTGLEWQRCPYGQSWTGSGCSGTAWRGKWDDAVRITASDGFRVPTFNELKTLAPHDTNIFPGGGWFWSSSPHANYSNSAWFLSFCSGHDHYGSKRGNYRVRLVRFGQ